MKGKRGLTLLEVMVVSSLLALVMLFVAPIMGPAGRIIQRADTDTHAQQIAVIALEKLFQDIAYSDGRGFTLQQTPQLCLVYPSTLAPNWNGLPPLDPLNDLNLLPLYTTPVNWLKFSLIYYDATAKNLCRKDLPYSGGDQLAQVKPTRVSPLASSAQPNSIIATGVQSLTIIQPTANVLTVDLIVSQTWDVERTVHLQTNISPRN